MAQQQASVNLLTQTHSQEISDSYVQNNAYGQSHQELVQNTLFQNHDTDLRFFDNSNSLVDASGNESFFKFLSAIITTLIVIFISHLWYVDKREEFNREQRELSDLFYCTARLSKLPKTSRKFEKNPRKISKSFRQKYSNRSRSSGRFRSLSLSESSLESIAESEDELLAEKELLDELLANQRRESKSSNHLPEEAPLVTTSSSCLQEPSFLQEKPIRVKIDDVFTISEKIEKFESISESKLQYFSQCLSVSAENQPTIATVQSFSTELNRYQIMDRKIGLSHDNLSANYGFGNYGPTNTNGLQQDSGHGSSAHDLTTTQSLQNLSLNLSNFSVSFEANSYNDFLKSLDNSVISTNDTNHSLPVTSQRTPTSHRKRLGNSATASRRANGVRRPIPDNTRSLNLPEKLELAINGHNHDTNSIPVSSHEAQTPIALHRETPESVKRKIVIPKVKIANELSKEDQKRTSLAEAYPYIKSESNRKVVIGITKDEDSSVRVATSKALNELQFMQEDFEVQSHSINGNLRSARSTNSSGDKLMQSASNDGLSASFIASSVSSHDKLVFEGLSKSDLRTHKDISFRRKYHESMSSDDNNSVSVRELLDEVTDVIVMIRCRYKPCGKIKELKEAKNYYKMCHNCFTYYCSSNCRKHHWERHKIKCVYSRVNSTCKLVLNSIRKNKQIMKVLSQFAEKQFYPEGRGAVFLKFSSMSEAETFVRTFENLPPPDYITCSGIFNYSKQFFADILAEIQDELENYDPVSKMILAVGINILPYKESNKKVIPRSESNYITKFLRMRIVNEEGARIIKPETLVATSAVKQETFDTERQRSLFLTNLQRNLKTKGVNLRVDFPFVYQTVCEYVRTGEHFSPITIYPHNPETGQQFMCLIMPDSDPNFLSWVSEVPSGEKNSESNGKSGASSERDTDFV
ncbi:uncharacterized protein LOC142339120 [Convolutriloba macropyga]|uniref:uncharacterized protein LOC142339120 n=1 Tax=Convolutriloba macropyga TaxID=536237 RepID=UPI003F51C9AF